MRVGLFGGTFNPIHNGHLMLADSVVAHFSLDRLYVIPCRQPPHKQPERLAPADQRATMIALALPNDARYCVSDVEIHRAGPSYTIDTVNHFWTQLGDGAALLLPLGTDAFLEMHTWKQYRRLLTLVQPVVVTRQLNGEKRGVDDTQLLEHYVRSRLSPTYRYDPMRSRWCSARGETIHRLTVHPLDISSSQIRQRIRKGKSIDGLVPAAVGGYIKRKELYR